MLPNEYLVDIEAVLDWELNPGKTLRQAITDAAVEELGVRDKEGEISITVEDGALLAVFMEA